MESAGHQLSYLTVKVMNNIEWNVFVYSLSHVANREANYYVSLDYI